MGWRDMFSGNAPGTQSTQSTETPVRRDCVDIVDSVRGAVQKIPVFESSPLAPVVPDIIARRWPLHRLMDQACANN